MSARREALAYRVWAYCEPLEWNVTAGEVAEGIGEPLPRIKGLLNSKKFGHWRFRLRRTQQENFGSLSAVRTADAELTGETFSDYMESYRRLSAQ